MKKQNLSYQFCLDLVVKLYLLFVSYYWLLLYLPSYCGQVCVFPRKTAAMAEGATPHKATQARLAKGTGEKTTPGLSRQAVEKQASKLVL